MSEPKWTPGPWAYEPLTGQVRGSDKSTVARLRVPTIADGQLIAAAPKLYETLQKALDRLQRVADAGAAQVHLPEFPADDPGGCDGCETGWCQSAVDAIIEGREQYRLAVEGEVCVIRAEIAAALKLGGAA